MLPKTSIVRIGHSTASLLSDATGIVCKSETLFMSGDGENIPFRVGASLKAEISAVAMFSLPSRIEIEVQRNALEKR